MFPEKATHFERGGGMGRYCRGSGQISNATVRNPMFRSYGKCIYMYTGKFTAFAGLLVCWSFITVPNRRCSVRCVWASSCAHLQCITYVSALCMVGMQRREGYHVWATPDRTSWYAPNDCSGRRGGGMLLMTVQGGGGGGGGGGHRQLSKLKLNPYFLRTWVGRGRLRSSIKMINELQYMQVVGVAYQTIYY